MGKQNTPKKAYIKDKKGRFAGSLPSAMPPAQAPVLPRGLDAAIDAYAAADAREAELNRRNAEVIRQVDDAISALEDYARETEERKAQQEAEMQHRLQETSAQIERAIERADAISAKNKAQLEKLERETNKSAFRRFFGF